MLAEDAIKAALNDYRIKKEESTPKVAKQNWSYGGYFGLVVYKYVGKGLLYEFKRHLFYLGKAA